MKLKRSLVLQEIRRMKFEEVCELRAEKHLSAGEAAGIRRRTVDNIGLEVRIHSLTVLNNHRLDLTNFLIR